VSVGTTVSASTLAFLYEVFQKNISLMPKADLIIAATLVFYADVGCFQYIIKVGLVGIDLFRCSFPLSNTLNRVDIYGMSVLKDSRLTSWRSGRLLP
jgi:hypothetical protein